MEIDLNGDGHIDFDEFSSAITSHASDSPDSKTTSHSMNLADTTMVSREADQDQVSHDVKQELPQELQNPLDPMQPEVGNAEEEYSDDAESIEEEEENGEGGDNDIDGRILGATEGSRTPSATERSRTPSLTASSPEERRPTPLLLPED